MSFINSFAVNCASYPLYICLWIMFIIIISCFIWLNLRHANSNVHPAYNYQAILLPQALYDKKPLVQAQQCDSLAPTLPVTTFKINEIEELVKHARTIVKRNILSEEANQLKTRISKLQGSMGIRPEKRSIMGYADKGRTVDETIADNPNAKKVKKGDKTFTKEVNSEDIEPAWKKNWLKKQMEKEKKVEDVASPVASPRESKEKSKSKDKSPEMTTKVKPTQDTVDTEIHRVKEP